ncbi:hypothetical protein PTI98_007172 [Pleurotus ostreatus]|nr:hypothetical protein PTI98_007172 [Pleurotus ostreatus]
MLWSSIVTGRGTPPPSPSRARASSIVHAKSPSLPRLFHPLPSYDGRQPGTAVVADAEAVAEELGRWDAERWGDEAGIWEMNDAHSLAIHGRTCNQTERSSSSRGAHPGSATASDLTQLNRGS